MKIKSISDYVLFGKKIPNCTDIDLHRSRLIQNELKIKFKNSKQTNLNLIRFRYD